MVEYRFDYSEEKNTLLKETRGIGFEDVTEAVEKGNLLADLKHPKRKNQRLLIVKIEEYVYAVAYVDDTKRKVAFLKTLYPSGKLTREYRKRGGLHL